MKKKIEHSFTGYLARSAIKSVSNKDHIYFPHEDLWPNRGNSADWSEVDWPPIECKIKIEIEYEEV